VVAHSRGRRLVRLVDTPCFGRPVELVWRKRTWRCVEPACPTGSFTEQHEELARPRALLTARACWWAVGQLRREHASVQGLARQLGTAWRTVWSSVKPLLEAMAADESRFEGVGTLGVDEHVWHHVSTKPEDQGGRGPKQLTGMVDLTRDAEGRVRARLLDLVPGRSGAAYREWLQARNEQFRGGVQIATLDPFHGYKNAIDDQLEDAVAVLDAFHVTKLGTDAVDQVRRRVQQTIHGHRGRRTDPLYGIRTILRCGAERLTDKQITRLDKAILADERHDEVYVAWQCAQQLRSAYQADSLAEGRRIAEQVLASFPTCPTPYNTRLGKTLKQWRQAFLAYFDTGRANNGGTEAINGLIELHRRIARGFRNRDNYRLRMLLIGGGLDQVRPT
jgi:transposase